MIDFSQCSVDLFRAYAGANGNKIGIIYKDIPYMLKFPPISVKGADISYKNSSISEYISCHIFQMAGIETQDTLLGYYKVRGKNKVVVACRDFTNLDTHLMAFAELKNTCLNSEEGGYGTELSHIVTTIEEQKVMDPIEIGERFWDMFIMDALLGNFDRHNGNWGFLVNRKEQLIKLAPVFDCGSCLYPQISEEKMIEVLEHPDEIDKRIYMFPTSAIKENDKKINYAEYIGSGKNPDCNAALMRIYPRINLGKIYDFINSIEHHIVSDSQKKFYCQMLKERKEKILDPGMKIARKGLHENSNFL